MPATDMHAAVIREIEKLDALGHADSKDYVRAAYRALGLEEETGEYLDRLADELWEFTMGGADASDMADYLVGAIVFGIGTDEDDITER